MYTCIYVYMYIVCVYICIYMPGNYIYVYIYARQRRTFIRFRRICSFYAILYLGKSVNEKVPFAPRRRSFEAS